MKRGIYIFFFILIFLFGGGFASLFLWGDVGGERRENVVSIDENEEYEKDEAFTKERGMDVAEETEIPKQSMSDMTSSESLIDHVIPFTSQAPLAQWDDMVFQNGCEEASLLMADRFFRRDTTPFDHREATQAIQKLSQIAQEELGEYRDLSARDTAHLVNVAFGWFPEVRENVTQEDMKSVLRNGGVLIVPVNGRLLINPHFTPPGPLYHMLVVRGYDDQTGEFITNDPGTRLGEKYRYLAGNLYHAMHDYDTGYHGDTYPERKVMLVVYPDA